MKLLLDTHIWLWYLLKDHRLSSHLQDAITNPSNELWLSPISVWEAIILAEKKRISLQPDVNTWINLALKNLETLEASLNHDIAILNRQIELPHQDPADRFIVATAIHYQLTLVTVDSYLITANLVQTLS